jgi:hypothetical protein
MDAQILAGLPTCNLQEIMPDFGEVGSIQGFEEGQEIVDFLFFAILNDEVTDVIQFLVDSGDFVDEFGKGEIKEGFEDVGAQLGNALGTDGHWLDVGNRTCAFLQGIRKTGD